MQNLSFNEARWLQRPRYLHVTLQKPATHVNVPKLYPADIALEELALKDLANFAGYESMEATRAAGHGLHKLNTKINDGIEKTLYKIGDGIDAAAMKGYDLADKIAWELHHLHGDKGYI